MRGRSGDKNTLYLDWSSCQVWLVMYILTPTTKPRQSTTEMQSETPPQWVSWTELSTGFSSFHPLCDLRLCPSSPGWYLLPFRYGLGFLWEGPSSPPHTQWLTISSSIQVTTAGHSWHVPDGRLTCEGPAIHFLNHTSHCGAGPSRKGH